MLTQVKPMKTYIIETWELRGDRPQRMGALLAHRSTIAGRGLSSGQVCSTWHRVEPWWPRWQVAPS